MKEALKKLLQAPQEANANAIHDIIADCVRGTGTIGEAIEDIVRGGKRNNLFLTSCDVSLTYVWRIKV